MFPIRDETNAAESWLQVNSTASNSKHCGCLEAVNTERVTTDEPCNWHSAGNSNAAYPHMREITEIHSLAQVF
jgi:hypothetical protein